MHHDQFTSRAQSALREAHRAALQLGHSYVGSEHLLLGLLSDPDSTANRALAQQKIRGEQIRSLVTSAVGVGLPGVAPSQGLTQRARRIIRAAAEESGRSSSPRVGTGHLLLGLLGESGATGTRTLRSAGADLRKLQVALMQRGGGDRSQNAARAPVLREEPPRSKLLEQFTRSLSAQAREGKLDPVIGRDVEVERLIRILSRRTKNNPILLGEPGVGKTAVVEGLARRIAAGDVPEELQGTALLSIDLAAMLAGTKYRGEFEERVKNAVAEVRKMNNVVLFIDEIHNIVGAGSAEGAVDAANLLKPALSRGEIRLIGATTPDEYRRYVEKDAALARRFQPVTVAEPTPETAVEILTGLRERYEHHHRLTITDGAIHAAVELSRRYLPDRFLPDKAIDLVDEACSRRRLDRTSPLWELKQLEEKLEQTRRDKAAAVSRQDYEGAARLRDAEADFLRELESQRRRCGEGKERCVTAGDIAAVAAEWTGIPVTSLTESDRQRLLRLEETLKSRVVGQEEAVADLARAVRRGRLGLREPGRPIGSFLLLGPTGAGKTELCRALAEAVYGREDAMIRVDMSEFSQGHAASRLVGAPPGYVGHDDGGQLTEQVRRKPWSLVLFDEVEKAHAEVWDLLLQIMEDGVLTDSHGRRVDFSNTIIAMTGNVGARHLTPDRTRLGFSSGDSAQRQTDARRAVMAELKTLFRPEFLGRVDEVLLFRPLGRRELEQVARGQLAAAARRVRELGLRLTWTDGAVELLARLCADDAAGARAMRRLVQRQVVDPIADGLLSGQFGEGDGVVLRSVENALAVEKEMG